jgi:CBS domain-containing protein
MNVADAMTPRSEVVTVSLPGTRDDVLEYIQERGFSSVPVVKEADGGEAYRGLISRDDLIAEPDEDQLALLMQEVPTIGVDATIEEAAELMRSTGARRVPVVTERDDHSELEGIVTLTDVVRAIARGEVPGDVAVDQLATPTVNTTYAGTPLSVAERELHFADEPYAVALDDDAKMAGVITEADIIAVASVVEGEDDAGASVANQDDEWMWEGIKETGNRYLPTRNVEFPDGPVSEYMTADIVTVTGKRTAQDAAQSMISNDIEQIPLVRAEALAGMVRDVDLLEAL